MADFSDFDLNGSEKKQERDPFDWANYYDLDDRVTVDFSEVAGGEASEPEENFFFGGEAEADEDHGERRTAEREEVPDAAGLRRYPFYAALAIIAASLLLLVVCTVATTSKASKNAAAGGLKNVRGAAETTGDGSVLYSVLDGYRAFVAHEENVRNDSGGSKNGTLKPEETAGPSPGNPGSDPTPSESPSETPGGDSPEPAQTPEGPKEGTIVASAYEDFYVFDLGEKNLAAKHLKSGDYYTSGVGSDNAGELLVSPSGKDIEYGFLKIRNPYGCEGFELRSVLKAPLVIRKPAAGSTPVILYYTHTSESYCLSEEERSLKDYPDIAGYDRSRSIAGRGEVFKAACRGAGTGVALISQNNDSDYANAYEVSRSAVEALAADTPEAQLALDLHVNSVEYPAGKRYAPTVSKDDKKYAQILFVITQNSETNPYWKENVKLAIFIIEKLEEEVPGITLGISLRNDAKYNSVATRFGLLAEIGFEGNLAGEADLSAEVLGRVIGNIFAGKY